MKTLQYSVLLKPFRRSLIEKMLAIVLLMTAEPK